MINTNKDILKISGSIGMVKLTSLNKSIFIFYDDHSNISYCKDNASIFLYDVFDLIIKSNTDCIILLEEPFVSNYSNIKFLWNETPHIVKFRNFYKKVISECADTKMCKIFPIDIRLLLCDVSIDELISNINFDNYFTNYNPNIFEYFKCLFYIFEYNYFDENTKENFDSNLKFLKKVFSIYNKDKYYINLKKQFDIFSNKFIIPNKNQRIREFLKKHYINNDNWHMIGFPFENKLDDEFLNQYDKLINGLMELYTYILLTGMPNKNIIIYSGYSHSNNLTFILKKYYNYNCEYDVGNTQDIEKKQSQNVNNCLIIDKKIFKF